MQKDGEQWLDIENENHFPGDVTHHFSASRILPGITGSSVFLCT